MSADEAEPDEVPVDDRTPEEREASRVRIRAWLERPDVSALLEELRRLDPKGKPRER